MLFDHSDVREVLQRMVRSMSSGAASAEDLMQEALIHLWQQEARCPDHSQSWYLQSCRFHLQHYLTRGRSVDSTKRSQDCCLIDEESDEVDLGQELQAADESPLASACAHDMLELLSQRVKPAERVILKYMAEGFGSREIARKLRVSHQCVSKHRMHIAAVAIQLGISPRWVERARAAWSCRSPAKSNSYETAGSRSLRSFSCSRGCQNVRPIVRTIDGPMAM